jgi:hypothetical protein
MNRDYKIILLGIFGLSYVLFSYLNRSYSDLYIFPSPLFFISSLAIINGVFGIKKYYNPSIYFAIVSVMLLSMWILIYFMPILINNKILFSVIFTFLIIWVVYDFIDYNNLKIGLNG